MVLIEAHFDDGNALVFNVRLVVDLHFLVKIFLLTKVSGVVHRVHWIVVERSLAAQGVVQVGVGS